MPDRIPRRPTDAELGTLRVLRNRGPSTVRQVREALYHNRPTGYTTALKLLGIVTDKGLVQRDEATRTHDPGGEMEVTAGPARMS